MGNRTYRLHYLPLFEKDLSEAVGVYYRCAEKSRCSGKID